MSGSEYNYQASFHGGRLLDRIQGSPNLMHFGSNNGDHISSASSPIPGLERASHDGRLTRPNSRLSQSSSFRGNAAPINYKPHGDPRFRPYSQNSTSRSYSQNSNNRPLSAMSNNRSFAGERTNSRNSYRTDMSGRSFGTHTTSIRQVKDTYYPKYEGNKVVGTYDRSAMAATIVAHADASLSRLPDPKPWFTPEPTRSNNAISIRNLIAGTTLQDIYVIRRMLASRQLLTFDKLQSTFLEYGTIQLIELLEEYTNSDGHKLLSVLILFEKRDDADRAHHSMEYVHLVKQSTLGAC